MLRIWSLSHLKLQCKVSDIVLSDIVLNVVVLSDILLSVVVLSDIVLSGVVLSVFSTNWTDVNLLY